MTLALNSRVTSTYNTNGVMRDYPFGFRVFHDSESGSYGLEVRKVTGSASYEVLPRSSYIVIPPTNGVGQGVVRFHVPPASGQQIYIAGNTSKAQQLNLANYGRYNAKAIETQFDYITAIIQEWISALAEEERQRKASDTAVNTNVQNKFNEWKIWAEANVPAFAQVYLTAQLSGFVAQWTNAMNSIRTGRVPALVVDTSSGQTQQQINDQGGAKWWNKAGGYQIGDSVKLNDGRTVTSTVANNTTNPNVSMTGWTLPSDLDIVSWSGRLLSDRGRDFVTDTDYGAIADGTYRPLSQIYPTLALARFVYYNISAQITSLTQSIDWAAAQSAIVANTKVWLKDGTRIINDTIEIPTGHGFEAFEKTIINANSFMTAGTAFLFYGTGPKRYICPTLGDDVYQTANPSAGQPYLADSGTRGNTYKLQNFNQNFSAGIILNAGSYLNKVAVLCYHSVGGGDGFSGYSAGDSGACADQWDVGVWARNCSNWKIDDVFARGQFRKAGLLISASQITGGPNPVANDGWQVQNSVFAGGAGLSIRSDNAAIAGFNNYGFGNGTCINCQFFGYAHQSSHLATSSYLVSPLDRPSATLELNGSANKPRGVDFISCTFMGRDDISMFAGYASEIKFIGCYQETKGLRVGGVWTDNTEGSRMVVSADSNLQFVAHSKYGVDFTPNMTRDNGVQRFGSAPGCFSSNSVSSDDDYEEFKYINSSGPRLRRAAGMWGVADYLNQVIFSVDWDGDAVAAKSITANGVLYFKGGIENINPGSATTLRRMNGAGNMDTFLWASGSSLAVSFYGSVTPGADNVNALGSSAQRWSTIHAGTATINTSDERLKQDFRPLDEREKAAALEIKNSIGIYRFRDAAAEKGDDARLHIGVMAQQVMKIMQAHDLDAFHYGFLCYDEWEAEEEDVEEWETKIAPDDIWSNDSDPVLLYAKGDVIKEAGRVVNRPAIEAGDRYGIRYEELIMFILSTM